MTASAEGSESAMVVVGREGRVLIPAQLRRDLQLGPGSRLLVHVEDGRLVMETPEQLMDRIQRDVAEAWQGPADTSVVDDLLADRRREAADDESAP
ncbi:AbrB/MazE/SpoVT family DNA-binding domain-containing protein [Actinomycetospora sp. OC33-EN08]|uniref:AbrB/MazE/SpoVT family DNA-binding domain-containing protein n=1 Tax=Actinomycetospora aurantiaca TaxID=3129233 RepID=A0ABU8MYD8_9PSEU